jgi:GAF domain-containing protein
MSERKATLRRMRAPAEGARARAVSQRLERALAVAAAASGLRHQEHLQLLEVIVSTAVRVTDATAGSLMLVDHATEELEFQVAVGPSSEQIKKFRVPIGQGIAGFVASTGQALAIADTSHDTRFARQIAEGSGYVPKNLLCVPLMLRGSVIGAMELLDKRGSAATFTPADTALLFSFSEQAALTIDLSLHARSLERLLAGAAGAGSDAGLGADITRAVEAATAMPGFDRTLVLARLVAAIGAAGEREFRLAEAVLSSVLDYLAEDPASGGMTGLFTGAFR